LAITVFNIVSAIFQTPAGLLADRIGAFTVLVAGLVLGAIAFALTGLVHSYWFLVAMFGIAGLANTVYHPADYALLSHHVAGERMGSAFSIHTFAGMLGGAVAPATILFAQTLVGWRGAFIVAAIAGLVVAAALMLLRDDFSDSPHHAAKTRGDAAVDRRQLLRSWPIMASFVFFTMLSASGVGVQNFSPVALQAIFNTPLEIGNVALTASLLLSAIGVLAGGVMVTRIRNHQAFAALGMFISGLTILLAGTIDLGSVVLILLMSVSGFAGGLIMPSRDLLVREVTRRGVFGTVFGFVKTGLCRRRGFLWFFRPARPACRAGVHLGGVLRAVGPRSIRCEGRAMVVVVVGSAAALAYHPTVVSGVLQSRTGTVFPCLICSAPPGEPR
jgi:sugar phosphate permease